MPGKVREIPAHTNEPIKYVVIYARVSSNRIEQLESVKFVNQLKTIRLTDSFLSVWYKYG